MVIAKIKVDGVSAVATELSQIPKGIQGATIEVTYGGVWESLNKTAVFSGSVVKDVVNAGAVIPVPPETVAKSGHRLRVGFYGVDGENKVIIPTLWVDLGAIQSAADPSGDASTNPSLPVWAQLQAEFEALKEAGGIKGEKGDKGEPGEDYVLTEADKTEIAEMAAGLVEVPEGGGSADAVLYTKQTLTEEQKAQAIENIGAAPMSLFNIIEGDVVDNLTSIMPAEEAFTIGKYCNPDHGRIVDTTNYRSTEDYIAFPAGAKLMTHYSGSTTKERYPVITYYDANKIHIGGELGNSLTQEDYEGKLCAFYNVPENTRFIRLSAAEETFSKGYFKDVYLYAVTDAKVNGGVKIPDLIVPLSALENSDILLSGALPLLGKTIVNFGDSIFGNARPPKDISTMLANLTGATVKNCAFGGCRMAVHVGHWDAFSMYRLAYAIANKDYSLQDEAINYDDRVSYAEEPLALIKETDFSKVDIVTIAYGTNDWTGNNALDNADNLYDTTTVCGALRYSVETLLTAFPQLRIFVLLPTYRFWMDDTGAFTEDSETKTNSHGKTLEECRQAITDVAEDYNLPVIDNYKRLGINKFNRTQYFPANDGSHHNENGRIAIAAHIAKNLW